MRVKCYFPFCRCCCYCHCHLLLLLLFITVAVAVINGGDGGGGGGGAFIGFIVMKQRLHTQATVEGSAAMAIDFTSTPSSIAVGGRILKN